MDGGGVTTFRAYFSGHLARGFAGFRGVEYTHVSQWIAFFIQDAKHRITVNDQAGNVGYGGWPGLLATFFVGQARNKRHKVAQRLGIVEQLAQLHANPGRINHPHIK